MTKLDLAKRIVQQYYQRASLGLSKTSNITDLLVRQLLQITFDCMTEALVRGETLEFRDFGVFKTRVRKPRVGRNPKAGTTVQIPQKKAIVWKMGKGLKERLGE